MANATHIASSIPAFDAGAFVRVDLIDVLILVGSGLHEVPTT